MAFFFTLVTNGNGTNKRAKSAEPLKRYAKDLPDFEESEFWIMAKSDRDDCFCTPWKKPANSKRWKYNGI